MSRMRAYRRHLEHAIEISLASLADQAVRIIESGEPDTKALDEIAHSSAVLEHILQGRTVELTRETRRMLWHVVWSALSDAFWAAIDSSERSAVDLVLCGQAARSYFLQKELTPTLVRV